MLIVFILKWLTIFRIQSLMCEELAGVFHIPHRDTADEQLKTPTTLPVPAEVQKTTWGFSPSFVFDIQSPVIQKQLETNVKMLHYSWSTPGHWLSGASFTNTKSSRGRSYTGVVDRRRDVDGTKGQQEHEVLMSLDERRMCGLPGQRAGCLGNASLLSQSVFRPSG